MKTLQELKRAKGQDRRFAATITVLTLATVTFFGACSKRPAVLHDFTSDGCSLFPDGNLKDRTLWCDCCFTHDVAYWRGGTADERKAADEALKACVLERTRDGALAEMMFAGVRMGGHPAFPTWYRWGYGWSYGRGYSPLTDDEQGQVQGKWDAYQRDHSSGFCAKDED